MLSVLYLQHKFLHQTLQSLFKKQILICAQQKFMVSLIKYSRTSVTHGLIEKIGFLTLGLVLMQSLATAVILMMKSLPIVIMITAKIKTSALLFLNGRCFSRAAYHLTNAPSIRPCIAQGLLCNADTVVLRCMKKG